jgi:hypothetical protein
MGAPARWARVFAALGALTLALLVWTQAADARFDAGAGFAGVGGLLFPAAARVIDADDFDVGFGLSSAAQPSYQGGSLGMLFNRPGLIGGFAAGFLGAGLLGLLFGHGLYGELGSVTSVLGVGFQLVLIAMLTRLIWNWWHADKTDALDGPSPRQLADVYGRSRHEVLPDIDVPGNDPPVSRERPGH